LHHSIVAAALTTKSSDTTPTNNRPGAAAESDRAPAGCANRGGQLLARQVACCMMLAPFLAAFAKE
jgi:hypothetical protein